MEELAKIIRTVVCDFYGVSEIDVASGSREVPIPAARRVAGLLMLEYGISRYQMGRYLGVHRASTYFFDRVGYAIPEDALANIKQRLREALTAGVPPATLGTRVAVAYCPHCGGAVRDL